MYSAAGISNAVPECRSLIYWDFTHFTKKIKAWRVRCWESLFPKADIALSAVQRAMKRDTMQTVLLTLLDNGAIRLTGTRVNY